MSSILCLAHYCDTHGPTAILVTEAFPVGCTSCYQENESYGGSRRPSTSARSLNPADGLSGAVSAGGTESMPSKKPSGLEAGGIPSANSQTSIPAPAMETPPESPRVLALQGGHGGGLHRPDSSFRKTYDENDKKRAIPCDNCALTLPKKTKDDPIPYSKVESNGPILRTRKPYERVIAPMEEPSPPKSASSASSGSESAITSKPAKRTYSLHRVTTSSSDSSFSSASTTHDHHVDYTSSHEPLSSTSFSIIRQSCLRTLSCETLPPSSQFPSASPTSPLLNSPLSAISSSGSSTSSGGPIFFGDPLAGYTTAFLFRIPDPNARGRRRIYALMALSTHRQQRAMQTFPLLTVAFRELASWIQGLAEAELERSEMTSPRLGPNPSSNTTSTSSFLQGRNRGGDGRFSGMSLRSRGLAEIVGLPDFFIELHARFVRLLAEMSVLLGV
ncbi:hypothetical protein HYALB_00007410 [Hymenoscyphus albidus]|uniref:UDENN FLCN/SMCR8-type domain-containing protein n=1 Tax=Hymenoscyphus albidus TaxID=595503 RepID=A0A9N9LW26_9HELO|nr:hypothetical protein HYALB_00007410 [Hymenoscyphus albidus]